MYKEQQAKRASHLNLLKNPRGTMHAGTVSVSQQVPTPASSIPRLACRGIADEVQIHAMGSRLSSRARVLMFVIDKEPSS